MQNTLRSPYFLALFASLGLALSPLGCAKEPGDESAEDETETGDGDGDTTGDGDGDGTTTGDGDGDGDGDTGDGDGDTGDGDGDECMGEGLPGGDCTSPCDCESGNCYLVPILGGQCGECDEDIDCPDGGCSPPNPFEANGPVCNMGEAGGGCETDEVCQEGLSCGLVLSVLGVLTINTCGECKEDAECEDPEKTLCAPIVVVEDFSGINTCIVPGTLEQDSFCTLPSEGGNGDEACLSGICSVVSIEGIAEIGSCGECTVDGDDCGADATCVAGGFDLDTGTLSGSTCVAN